MTRSSRAARTIGGAAMIAAGSILLVLPGPGLAFIAAGIAVMPDGRRKLARVRAILEPRARAFVRVLAERTARSTR